MSSISWLTAQPIAHRGYHDTNKTVWENTLSAFKRAIDGGFAIECDLQYAADGVPVVFHDDDTQRLCNLPGQVRDRTSSELGLMSIGGTKDHVPTLKQLLQLCGGKVPLVIELKGKEGDDEGFVETVLEILADYEGPVALMSFDHWLLEDLKRLEAPYPIGLTAMGSSTEAFKEHERAMALGLDFVSYFYAELPNPFVSALREKQVPVITWTVRDQAGRTHSEEHADQMTFEGFDPRG